MKRSFHYTLSGAFVFLIFAVAAVITGSIVYGFLRIFEIFGLYSSSIAMDVIAIVLSLIFLALLVFTLTASYKITDGKLALKLGFWDVTGGKFKIEKVIKIVKAANTDKLYLNLYVNDCPQIVLVNISPKNFAQFVNALKEVNPKILYEEADVD